MNAYKARGFSKDPRIRERQQRVLEVYAELAPFIAGDKALDRAAMITAVERAGYTRLARPESKLAQFMRLWKSDESRAYLCHLWGLAVEDEADQDPVSLAMRMIHEHIVQTDDSWGPRDRAVSLAATNQLVKMVIPQQTSKVATLNLSAKVERPAEFDTDQPMQARAILPAGEKIAKPTGPTGSDDDDDDESEDDDD